jgi:hypothetical protein
MGLIFRISQNAETAQSRLRWACLAASNAVKFGWKMAEFGERDGPCQASYYLEQV